MPDLQKNWLFSRAVWYTVIETDPVFHRGKEAIRLVHEGHRQRLKERFASDRGAGLMDHELLELLLSYAIPRKDTNALAHELIRRFGSLHAVFYADIADLKEADGIGEHAAVLIALFRPLENAVLRSRGGEKITLDNIRAMKNYCVSLYNDPGNEQFFVLSLDSRLRLIRADAAARGTPDQVSVFPRTVVSMLIRRGATGCVLSHNHPAGTPEPSQEDLRLTETLRDLMEPLGIRLYDHILVADGKGLSFREMKYIK